MALKVNRGIRNLSANSNAVRIAFMVSLTIIAIGVLAPKRDGKQVEAISETITASSKVAPDQRQSVDKELDAEPVRADAISAHKTDGGIKKTAKIVTCPRCRLNSLPLVKKFVYEHAKFFEPALKVDFIVGRDPVLFLYEDDKEVSKIDLAKYDWKQIIQKLAMFGIKPTSETSEIREALGKQ